MSDSRDSDNLSIDKFDPLHDILVFSICKFILMLVTFPNSFYPLPLDFVATGSPSSTASLNNHLNLLELTPQHNSDPMDIGAPPTFSSWLSPPNGGYTPGGTPGPMWSEADGGSPGPMWSDAGGTPGHPANSPPGILPTVDGNPRPPTGDSEHGGPGDGGPPGDGDGHDGRPGGPPPPGPGPSVSVGKRRCRRRRFRPYANKTVSQVHGIVTVVHLIETAFVYVCVVSMQANIQIHARAVYNYFQALTDPSTTPPTTKRPKYLGGHDG